MSENTWSLQSHKTLDPDHRHQIQLDNTRPIKSASRTNDELPNVDHERVHRTIRGDSSSSSPKRWRGTVHNQEGINVHGRTPAVVASPRKKLIMTSSKPRFNTKKTLDKNLAINRIEDTEHSYNAKSQARPSTK